MKSTFMIAAPTSGSGKTTLARGLMALLYAKGYKVQPFKCGPDYIDTKFHEAVCKRPSINLDTFMATEGHVQALFRMYGADADVCVVEGMMGLFDGYDRDRGSSGEIARVLDIPVVLVVDAKSMAYSMAPLLSGFINFRKDVHICGVIFNKVGSEKHFRILQQACNDIGITCFGYLPKDTALEQGSRYLGLDFSETAEVQQLVQLLDEHIDWRRLISTSIHLDFKKETAICTKLDHKRKILIARNAESFSFLYQETIDRFGGIKSLESQSDYVSFFDPETDHPRLDGVDLLYLPGGYPEKHLEALVANDTCRKAIKDFAERGGRIIAECGGMMYLCKSIVSDEGEFPMCGVLPYTITARKADRKPSLGYRRFKLNGREYRGHEFHYTQFLNETPESIVQVYDAKGEPVNTPVFNYQNVLASYTHLYQL